MFKVGDKVKVISQSHGWGPVHINDIGIVASVGINSSMIVDFPVMRGWRGEIQDFVSLKPVTKERRKAAVLTPKDYREQTAVRLIERVVKGEGRFTAVKVESEGNMQRGDHCKEDCSMRLNQTPHLGCKYFGSVNVANDFILRELAKHGLAKRCKNGDNPWGFLYAPKLPLVYSKVYTDSETEWTTTLSLEKSSDVLYTPFLVDAFNALIEANGNGVNVGNSGMHTAFIQGKDGTYPSDTTSEQKKIFTNFAKSMLPLLPALYLLGANRMENGQGITRALSYRQPLVSSSEKYSAIAYRYGALEFRVFDTCYDNREQLLDNIVVMAQSVSKYWHKKYVKPAIEVTNGMYFGNSSCENNHKNKIESLYVVKDHIVLLNKGLRCIKPPYMTVKEVKKARNFKLTVRGIKNKLDVEKYRDVYNEKLKQAEVNKVILAAHEFYKGVENLRYVRVDDFKKETRKLQRNAKAYATRNTRLPNLEQIAYTTKFGKCFPLSES